MRDYTDDAGRTWDVVVGRESWGTLCALFVPRTPHQTLPVRQAVLHADDHVSAETELASMDHDEMTALFQRTEIREG